MNLKQYKAFLAVARYKSFSEAAEKTQISQPTLSRLVKQLEDEMEVELFDRYHRPLQLTSVGDFFYKKLNILINELDTLTTLTKKMGKPSPTLTIGFVPSVLYSFLPDAIAELKQQCPDLQIQLRDISSYKQIDALKSGEIDVGLGRFDLRDKLTQQILLKQEAYVVALPTNHSLIGHNRVDLNDLVNNTLILYNRTYLPKIVKKSVTEPLLNIFNSHSLTPHQTTSVSDLQIALGLVAAGEGITLVPESLQTQRVDKIVYRPIKQNDATTPIYLQTLSQHYHPSINKLLQVIYEVFKRKNISYKELSLK